MNQITPKMTFSEYWKSKDRLMSASDETPRIMSEYTVKKYCKVPFFESVDSDEKTYVSFKPNDVIRVQWEYHDLSQPTPKFVTVVSESTNYFPCWNNIKMLKWVDTNTIIND